MKNWTWIDKFFFFLFIPFTLMGWKDFWRSWGKMKNWTWTDKIFFSFSYHLPWWDEMIFGDLGVKYKKFDMNRQVFFYLPWWDEMILGRSWGEKMKNSTWKRSIFYILIRIFYPKNLLIKNNHNTSVKKNVKQIFTENIYPCSYIFLQKTRRVGAMFLDKIQVYLPKQGRSPIPRSSTISIRIFGLVSSPLNNPNQINKPNNLKIFNI